MNLLTYLVFISRNEQEEGFYNEYLVTQHDILRELAIHQSGLEAFLERKRLNLEIREAQFPDWCLNQMEPIIINASLLSISTGKWFILISLSVVS